MRTGGALIKMRTLNPGTSLMGSGEEIGGIDDLTGKGRGYDEGDGC